MNTDEHRYRDPRTASILRACFEVSNELGAGFLEKPYENALVIELRAAGHRVEQQVPMDIVYKGQVVGQNIADILVDGEVLVEVKAVRALDSVHVAQCMNYLRATKLRICLLVNFGNPRVEYQRIVC